MNIIKKTIKLPDGREITIETGKLAKQADGAVEVRMGNTMLLATVVTAKEAGEGLAEQLGAELVQVIGNRFVLYRRSQRDDVEHIRLVRE